MKNLENSGLMMPKRYPMTVEKSTKATAAPAPRSRFLANARVLFGLPPGSKSGPGLIWRQMPVKERPNSSIGTLTSPLAGSLIHA